MSASRRPANCREPFVRETLPSMRYFNTSGPVVSEDHYCIPPLERLKVVVELSEVLGYV